MPTFSKESLEKLGTCHPALQEIFAEAVKHFDCAILEGRRDEEKQNALFHAGKSKVRFPDGKHNASPSLAVDAAPWPVNWADRERFSYFAGLVMGIAALKGITLRWGGDWDRDTLLDDNSFDDLPHFEIVV